MKVTNKTKVEGSIVKATIVKEIGSFYSFYFVENSNTNPKGLEQVTLCGDVYQYLILRAVSSHSQIERLSMTRNLKLHTHMSFSTVQR